MMWDVIMTMKCGILYNDSNSRGRWRNSWVLRCKVIWVESFETSSVKATGEMCLLFVRGY